MKIRMIKTAEWFSRKMGDEFDVEDLTIPSQVIVAAGYAEVVDDSVNGVPVIKRYTSTQSGVSEHEFGHLLRVEEVIKYLEYCLDDDEQVIKRITSLIDFLTKK